MKEHLITAWGEPPEEYTLIAQGNFTPIDAENYLFVFASEVSIEEERKAELALYCNRHPGLSFRVNGKKANTFLLGDRVEILTPGKRIELQFHLEKGEGVFMGHLFPGTRSSHPGSTDRFVAHDWKISLRSLRRSPDCQIRLSVKF